MTAPHSLRIDDAINTCRDRAVKILRQTDWAETPGDITGTRPQGRPLARRPPGRHHDHNRPSRPPGTGGGSRRTTDPDSMDIPFAASFA